MYSTWNNDQLELENDLVDYLQNYQCDRWDRFLNTFTPKKNVTTFFTTSPDSQFSNYPFLLVKDLVIFML